MDDPGVSELCSVLLTNLPEDWFRLSDPRKLEKLGNAGNFIAVTSKDESKKAAVVRMLKKPGVAPTVDIPRCGAAVIIKHEEASITLQLSSTEDRNLLISTTRGLNIKVVEEALNTFKISGSLEFVTEFREQLEVKIMTACLDARRQGQCQGGASANAVSTDSGNVPGRDALESDASGAISELKPLGDRWNPSILILMKCLDQTHGCVVKPSTGEVFVGADSNQNLFYGAYDIYSRQKLKSEVLKIPKHISITPLNRELQLLKEKHDHCGFLISDHPREIKIVSSSFRQFESFLAFVKNFLSGLSYTLPCGRVLSLLRGNIVQEKVDSIVNAANGSLDHAGGVAKAINDASHGEVQHFSNQFMRHRGVLRAGEVAVTHAGQYLNCKTVIHAVGPTREHGNCRRVMIHLVHAILNKGEELGAESIALPAISTGIFGVSKDLVAECLFKEIPAHRFRKSLPVLSDIRVVIIDQPTFSCFHKNFTKILPSKETVDRSSSLPSGVVPSNSRSNAHDSRSARKEVESYTAGHDRGSHKSRNKSRSPVDPDSKENKKYPNNYERSSSMEGKKGQPMNYERSCSMEGKKGQPMNYERSSSMEDEKNRKKDLTSSKVEGNSKGDSEIKPEDVDKLKLPGSGSVETFKNGTIGSNVPVGNGGMGSTDRVSGCPTCSAKRSDDGGGDGGNEIFDDAREDSSSVADKIDSNKGQGGFPTNSADGTAETSTVVDSNPDVSSEEPGSASSSDIHDPPSSSDVQDAPTATESSEQCPSTDSPVAPPPGLPCSSEVSSFSPQQNFSESSIKYPTTMSESSQYAAITSTSASDTASPPGLPQYSGGVGVLSASTVSKSSPQYATASTVSITVPPGRPQYSSVGGQPALYSAVAGQSVTQNFSSQPFQPTSIGQCPVCLNNYHMKNFARLRCGHFGCIDCASMSMYHCVLCQPNYV